MEAVRRALVLSLALVVTLGACRADGGDRDDATVDASAATGAGVDTADLVDAARPTPAEVEGLVGPLADPPETSARHCDAGPTLLAEGPEPETIGADDAVEVSGRDGGVRYTVVVHAQPVVHADAEAATEALASVDADAWNTCIADTNPDLEVGPPTVAEDDDRASVDAALATGPGDDTTYLAGVRLARVGRTIVVVEFAADGQVLDRFGDGDPVDALVDTLAERVAALG